MEIYKRRKEEPVLKEIQKKEGCKYCELLSGEVERLKFYHKLSLTQMALINELRKRIFKLQDKLKEKLNDN